VLFGLEGVGKSLAALDVAANIGTHTLFVIDNDNAWDRMLEGTTLADQRVEVREEYRWDGRDWKLDSTWCVESGNVVVFHADGWEQNEAAVTAVIEEATRDDWCCIDSGTALWSNVQDWYTDTVFGSSLADYMLALKKGSQTEDKDDPKWQIINARYAAVIGKFLVSPPCHLIVTAEQKDVNTAKERDKETKGLYGAHFVRPAGQKRMGHNVQTVIHLTKNTRGDEFQATTVKDRGGREYLDRENVTGYGFGEWYLAECAGWTEANDLAPAPVVKKVAPVTKAAAVVKKQAATAPTLVPKS
jgi:hypothetical protein